MAQSTVIKSQPLQTPIESLNKMLPRQAPVVDRIVAKRPSPIQFRRDDQIIPLPCKFLNGLTHHAFRLTLRIAFGTVEEINAGVIGSFHAGEGALCYANPYIRGWLWFGGENICGGAYRSRRGRRMLA